MDTKVTTVIVNDTEHGLTMKVGNRNCYARLTSVKKGGEYKMQIDVNWTYQEFLVQDKCNQANQLFINSDDCCDYERITIKDRFDVQCDVLMERGAEANFPGLVSFSEGDPPHKCRKFPCPYCPGR